MASILTEPTMLEVIWGVAFFGLQGWESFMLTLLCPRKRQRWGNGHSLLYSLKEVWPWPLPSMPWQDRTWLRSASITLELESITTKRISYLNLALENAEASPTRRPCRLCITSRAEKDPIKTSLQTPRHTRIIIFLNETADPSVRVTSVAPRIYSLRHNVEAVGLPHLDIPLNALYSFLLF